MSFGYGSSFDNRKILTEVVLTADVAKKGGQISKLITALSNETSSILVEEGGAIEIVVSARPKINPCTIENVLVRKQTGVRVFDASAVAQGWVEGRLVRAINRHARYEAELEVAAAELRRRGKGVKESWRAALVPVHPTNLPATEHLTADAMA